MSANEPLKALNYAGAMPALGKSVSVHPELRAPSDTQWGCWSRSRAGRFLAASGWPRTAVSGAILIAFSLFLAGCAVPETPTVTRLIAPARTEPEVAREPVPVAAQPEAPPKPAQPAPQQPQRSSEPTPPPSPISETRPPPATATKGAEQLVTLNVPAVVHARERTPLPAEAPAPIAPVAATSATVTDAPPQALFFKGPPPQARSSWAGIKWLVGLGLGLGGAGLAVLARIYAIRRAKPAGPAQVKHDELKMPPELLMKEPLNLPPETVLAEKPAVTS